VNPLRVVLRASAKIDVDDAIERYLGQAGLDVAEGFIDALGAAYSHIASHPGTGSPRYAVKLNLGGLRFWTLGHYPYLVFYYEMPDRIDVVRVLHASMDISQILDMGNRGDHSASEPAGVYELTAEWN
jgi:toxin ParE1/3/4